MFDYLICFTAYGCVMHGSSYISFVLCFCHVVSYIPTCLSY
uniref:Uncharacterized protein n=1 Tax=Arundo donax TaxID=35708 RepID=A0A0A9C7G0_ARUDO